MKKIFLFISLITLGANAQEIKGGIKFSPNFSTFSKEIDNSSSGKIGYTFGYYETMNFSESIQLQGEISYTQITYESNSYSGFGKSSKTTYTTNFIEIPLIIKYRVSEDFSIGGGYQYCIGLDADNDMGLAADISYDIANLRIGARYFMGSAKNYQGNSLNNISVSIGYAIF